MTSQFNINLGFDKLFEMIQSYFGPGVIRRKSEAENAARLSAARTDIEVRKLGVSAEYEEKKARLLAERDFQQFEEQFRAKELPPVVEGEILDDVPIVWVPEPEIVVAEHRSPLQYVEHKRLNNIKQVTTQAVDALKGLPPHQEVSEEPVDPDWTARFFDSVKDVSNADMQKLWGKLLAGEIANPGRFSLRTLDVLKNLTSAEAQRYHHYLQFCTNQADIVIPELPPSNEFSLYRGRLDGLVECGLLHTAKESLYGIDNKNIKLSYRNKIIHITVLFKIPTNPANLWSTVTYRLTRTGIELANLDLPPANEAFVQAVCESARARGYTVEVVENLPPSEPTGEEKPPSST
ncbi:DUF2806 domain-containing protein [Polyangium sp. 6x1]|uniref:DUF2806 domain-containing protein n=1 Tax=Polyangium sp. 6x1 TaxID=3042689 RepID=UPI0024823D0F|nr:DUF2806 domain-containing protein [Polyangium sp. 6x1]MDI1444182.1 DUF2806 domain-containing protein [Polyangium sp. 6x1]